MRPTCPNCGSGRPDRYCSRCGQNDRDFMRGLGAVVYEFLRESFELDSRIFRTMKLLLFRPGRLSSEFSHNRRAAYMSPVRLYLFASFAFFLILSFTAGGWLSNLDLWDLDTADADLETDVAADSAIVDSALAVDSVLAAVDSLLADRGLPAGLVVGALVDSVLADVGLAAGTLADSALADGVQADSASLRRAAGEADTVSGDESEGVTVLPGRLEAFKAGLSTEHQRKVDDILGRPDESLAKQVIAALASSEADGGERAGWLGWLVRYSRSLVIDLFHDPEDFLLQAIGNLPIAMFFLLPFFALALAACYFTTKRFFVEHLVFGMHIHTFVFLTLGAALFIPNEGVGAWFKGALTLIPSVYFLIALRNFYGEGWGRTLVKAFVVWNLYSCVLFPGLVVAALVRT